VDLVFLDANILFSAAHRSDAGLKRLWKLPGVRMITSAYAIEEAHRNLDFPKQRKDLEELLGSVKAQNKTICYHSLHDCSYATRRIKITLEKL